MNHRIFILFALWAAPSTACLPFDPADPSESHFDSPACSGPSREFDGAWTITGTGEREDCNDSNLNAEVLEIRARGLVFSMVDERLVLDRAASSVTGSFQVVESDIRGGCAVFTTVESTPRGTVRIEWQAAIERPGEATGSFDGFGPDDCQMRGRFNARIEPVENEGGS